MHCGNPRRLSLFVDIYPIMSVQNGTEQAWETLNCLNPEDVCIRARVDFNNSSRLYILKSFGQNINVSPADKKIFGCFPECDLLLNRLSYFSTLSILCYLINARDVPPSGKLINPDELKGGSIYLGGSHVLPLDKIADKYGSDIEGFMEKGMELGGEKLGYGDASIQLFPFPRVPVTMILWANDEEFSARSSLLFDSTCELQLPLDVIWSTSMMSVLMML